MGPTDIAELFKLYGPVIGGWALLIGAIIYLHKGWNACQEARIADAKVMAEAVTRQASTNTEIATALHTVREAQGEIMRVLTVLQRDAENDDERVQEKIGAVATRLGELATRIENACRGAPR